MRMKLSRLSSACLASAALSCALPELAGADAFSPACNKGGDQLGFSIATNGDFNGDGVNDIAIGAPCLFVRNHPHAGRVVIVDGRNLQVGGNGRRLLFRQRGGADHQWFGSSVSFLPDLNGDGRDEIAIGSPGYDVTIIDQNAPSAKLKERAGRVDVYTWRKRRFRVFGQNGRAGFGEKIAPLNDINGDGWDDFVVSASGDRNANGVGEKGRIWLVSGRNGDLLGYRVGPTAGNNYGRSLVTAADIDGDGLTDFLTGTDTSNGPGGVMNAGVADLISPADLDGEPLFQVYGAHRDRIGKTIDFAGDVNDDDVPDAIIGSDGSDDTGVRLAGLVSLYGMDGTPLWIRSDSPPQEDARFGDAVATIGDINGDGVTDFAAASPKQDYLVGGRLVPDAGRVVTLSGTNGDQIWELEGERRNEEFGTALAGGIDFDLDEVNDLVIGTPGDDPFARRGAGSVKIVSGVDGHELFIIPGRRGLETRLFTLAPDEEGDPRLRSFTRTGRRTEMNQSVLPDINEGEFSATIINDRPFKYNGDPHLPRPKQVHVVTSGGYNSDSSVVETYRVSRVKKLIDSFEAFPGESVGVDCGSGEINGRVNEDLVCAQSNSEDGVVIGRAFERLDEEAPFFLSDEFQFFDSTDTYNGTLPINADGANVEIGNVLGDKAEEIIVAPNRGVPIVKVFTKEGVFITQFLAYDPVGFSGVDLALADLNGSGDKWIVTAPREGAALIKVFDGMGTRLNWGPDDELIDILVRPAPYDGGARVAAADVDKDDQQEILVYIPEEAEEPFDQGHQVYAYEPTNKLVSDEHFNNPFNPLPGALTGGAIAATDRWTRN
jgi:hypothetical protein